MPRPYKPLKQRPNGVWFVQIKGRDGRRLTRSLETTDPLKATARASQALEELRAQNSDQSPSRWRSDEPGVIWDVPPGMEMTIENLDKYGIERHVTAADVLEPEQLRETSWYDLIREAEAKWKRKHSEGYSTSWHQNVGKAIKACPYKAPLRITPKQLNTWIKSQQDEGLAPKTIQARCSILSGLLTSSIKSGLLEGHANPFKQVDYTSNVVNSHVTPVSDNYQALFKADLPQEARLPIDLMAYTGLRVGEVQSLRREDIGANTVTVVDGKTKSSDRTLPVPAWIAAELKDWHFKWASNTYLNEQIKCAGEKITCHSMRHGWKRLSREAELDSVLAEAFLGHSLKGLEGTYGDGFSVDSLRRGADKVWAILDRWR